MDGAEIGGTAFVDPPADRLCVLHVDDDPAFLDLAAEFLSRELPDAEVLTAGSAAAGLSILAEERVDCVVSDYDMPGRNGLAFLSAVRERDPDLPFILFTGKGSEEIAAEAISAGVTDYLQKEAGADQYAVLANRIEAYVDRTRTAEALSESRRRLARLIGNLPGIVYRCANEPDWPMEFVSGGCEEMTGYPASAIESGEVTWGRDVIHPDDRDSTWAAVQDAVDADEPFEVTYRIRTAGGDERTVWEQGVGVFDDDGELVALEGFITDVSQRAELDTARQTVSSRLEAIVQASPEPIISIDLEGRVQLWNEAAEETFGWTAEEVLGEPYPAVPPDDSDGFEEMIHGVEAGEPTSGVEIERVTKDGERITLSLSSAPIYDAAGEVVATMGVVTDLTELRDRELALERQNERLERFARVLSHDLRNPLNVALGRLDMMEDADEHTAAVERAVRRMGQIIEDVLAVAREGQDVCDPTPVDAEAVVRDAWAAVETADADLDCSVSGTVPADAARLARLLENLFRNAVDHGGGDVAVRVGPLPDGFYVEDDGPGIPPEERESVFEFGHTTSASGNGFGLAIVQEIAEAHGWTVAATEGETGGARIEVRGVDLRGA